MKEKAYVYQYCVIDEEGELYQGLTTAFSRAEVIRDIAGNYGECQFLHVNPVNGLVPVMEYGQWTGQVTTLAAAQAAGRA